MAELIPQDGVVEVRGSAEVRGSLVVDGQILFNNGQSILQYDKLGKLRIVASTTINASTPKVIVVNPTDGYSISTGLLKGSVFSNYAEKVIGVAVNSIALNTVGEIVGRGIIAANGFDATSASVGDNVYVDSSGNLTLTVTQLLIGNVASATNPGIIYIDVNAVNTPYLVGQSSIPVGSVYAFLGSTAPTGYLLCDGLSYLVANYPGLHGVIGYNYGGSGLNFNVPDYRGMFLRGTGTHGSLSMAAGGNFNGPALHASQLDQGQGHTHRIFTGNNGVGGNDGWGVMHSDENGGIVGNPALVPTTQPLADNSPHGTPRTGNETRPVNYGVNYIIKV